MVRALALLLGGLVAGGLIVCFLLWWSFARDMRRWW
jgi:hypothetical protein